MNKKYNLIVPISGQGKRFRDIGEIIPKQLIVCADKTILEWSMSCLYTEECNLVFVTRQEYENEFSISSFLKEKFGEDIEVIFINPTGGASETVLEGIIRSKINRDLPLIVYCPDTYFSPKFIPEEEHFQSDGLILTFKANSPNYSYCAVSKEDKSSVIYTAEKQVISEYASVGVYCFKSTQLFLNHVSQYITEQSSDKKETHICPIYNLILGDNGTVKQNLVDKIHIMGTPEEFDFFENVSYKYLIKPRKFALCSDHSGFETKQRIKDIMSRRNIPYIDFGCWSKKDCDYNPYVKAVCKYVDKNKDYFGIGICRSGQGVNISASKHYNIRSALIQDIYHAEMSIMHNAANFFSISSIDFEKDVLLLEDVIEILNETTFSGGRHQNRIQKNWNK